ncbi:hypothetical protein ABT389_08120 [Streptomyces bacillaris]|uniref:hypothetical protein n=1 Tax=Streptomyces bacillaris TaxID=68179 RepID=UPI003357738C
MSTPVVQQKIAAAEKVARALSERMGDGIDSAYIAGSITAGLGNATSDADVFVLYAADHLPAATTQQFTLDGHRVDVEWYSRDELDDALRTILDWQLRPDNISELWGFADRLDLLARFATSQPVLSSEHLGRAYAALEAGWPRLRQALINYWAIAVNSDLEDFHGACAEGDLGTATYVGQVLLTSATKAVTTAADDRYFGRKWVYKQVNRSLSAGYPTERFGYFQRGDWAREGVAGANDLLEFVQTSVTASQLMAGEGVSPAMWPTWQFGDEGLFRDVSYNVLHAGDRVLLHKELHRQVTLKREVAFVWGLCQGVAPDTVVKRIEALSEVVPTLRTMTEQRTLSVIDALIKSGLLHEERSAAFGAPEND